MSNFQTTCPHCGKVLSSPDKLGWHLSRECPALVSLTTTTKNETRTPAHPPQADANRPGAVAP